MRDSRRDGRAGDALGGQEGRPRLSTEEVQGFADCIARGGVALFPADTVYGLACDPLQPRAVARLYELKGRPPARPAAVMFFALAPALDALPELGARERRALEALLPGPLTALLPNPTFRFPLAAAGSPDVLGLRVPLLPKVLQPLSEFRGPVMQSSANISGEPDAQRLTDVTPALLEAVDLVLDGGELPGVASTVLDLRDYEHEGRWHIVRDGPVGAAELKRALASC
jgi:L-threonylcarbamoyladenylate synthase